jgi:hypothetical protein
MTEMGHHLSVYHHPRPFGLRVSLFTSVRQLAGGVCDEAIANVYITYCVYVAYRIADTCKEGYTKKVRGSGTVLQPLHLG